MLQSSVSVTNHNQLDIKSFMKYLLLFASLMMCLHSFSQDHEAFAYTKREGGSLKLYWNEKVLNEVQADLLYSFSIEEGYLVTLDQMRVLRIFDPKGKKLIQRPLVARYSLSKNYLSIEISSGDIEVYSLAKEGVDLVKTQRMNSRAEVSDFFFAVFDRQGKLSLNESCGIDQLCPLMPSLLARSAQISNHFVLVHKNDSLSVLYNDLNEHLYSGTVHKAKISDHFAALVTDRDGLELYLRTGELYRSFQVDDIKVEQNFVSFEENGDLVVINRWGRVLRKPLSMVSDVKAMGDYLVIFNHFRQPAVYNTDLEITLQKPMTVQRSWMSDQGVLWQYAPGRLQSIHKSGLTGNFSYQNGEQLQLGGEIIAFYHPQLRRLRLFSLRTGQSLKQVDDVQEVSLPSSRTMRLFQEF